MMGSQGWPRALVALALIKLMTKQLLVSVRQSPSLSLCRLSSAANTLCYANFVRSRHNKQGLSVTSSAGRYSNDVFRTWKAS